MTDLDAIRARWAAATPGPWALAPREDKHYGTYILDRYGENVANVWTTDTAQDEPSVREKEYFGPDWTPEAWAEYVSDSHWETQRDLDNATAIAHSWNDVRALLELVRYAQHARTCEAAEAAEMGDPTDGLCDCGLDDLLTP